MSGVPGTRPDRGWPKSRAGRIAKQDDRGWREPSALDRLHVGGWSVGDTAFHDVDRGGIIHVVIGSNGEDQIRAEGATCREAWRRALDQAAEVGMLPGRPRPARE